MKRLILRLLAVLALVGALTACTQDSDSDGATGATSSVLQPLPRPYEWRDILLRGDRYYDDQSAIQRAEYDLVADCMKSEGYELPKFVDQTDMIFTRATPVMEFRRTYGYFAPGVSQALPTMTTEESARFDLALFGPDDEVIEFDTPAGHLVSSAGGCYGEARAELAGSVRAFKLATQVGDDYFLTASLAINETEEFKQVSAEWSECVDRKGFDADTPTQLSAQYRFTSNVPAAAEARKDAIAAAVADGGCQTDVGMPDVVIAARQSYIENIDPETRQLLSEIAESRSRTARNAKALLQEE